MKKKVFISYSWGDKKHQDWIINLGRRLMSDTVDVILDRWSLKDGNDIHEFMEEMVNSNDVFRVLIISDAKYQVKANEREGGVGTETQIITPNIYSNQKQEKFIPIVLERDENGSPCLPTYLINRKYIDFSYEENFEGSYEELLRNILEAPAIPKPKLGTNPPIYITEEKISISAIHYKIRTIENRISKGEKMTFKYLNSFIDLFLDEIWKFQLKLPSYETKVFGESLIESLKSYKPLREDFIKFIDLISGNDFDIDSDILIGFFENVSMYRKNQKDVSNFNFAELDIFKIIFHELFLYVIAVCLRNKDYLMIADLLNSKYYIKDPYTHVCSSHYFTFIYEYPSNFENYIKNQYNRSNGFGNFMISNLSEQVKKDEFILADTLCYVVSYLNVYEDYSQWFPLTYSPRGYSNFNFFEKFESKKHFEKVKVIFDVKNEKELQEKILKFKESYKQRLQGSGTFRQIPFIQELINPETISRYR